MQPQWYIDSKGLIINIEFVILEYFYKTTS